MNFFKIVEETQKSKIFRRNIISILTPVLKRMASFVQTIPFLKFIRGGKNMGN
jgi:hypothetical protein